jgi:hypothetical protein
MIVPLLGLERLRVLDRSGGIATDNNKKNLIRQDHASTNQEKQAVGEHHVDESPFREKQVS